MTEESRKRLVIVAGSVTATVASGDVSTESHASATFVAAAASGEADMTYAGVSAFADLTGSADRTVTLNYSSSSVDQDDGVAVREQLGNPVGRLLEVEPLRPR